MAPAQIENAQTTQQHAWKRDSVAQDAAATRETLEKGESAEAMRLRGPLHRLATIHAHVVLGGCVPCPDGSICWVILHQL